MARGVSPETMAKRIQQWADKGLDYSMVVSAKAAMANDVTESQARIKSRTGRLAATVRLTEPSATRTARKGFFSVNLAAGSKAKGNPVIYASVLQLGKVGGPNGRSRTVAHVITAKSGRLAFSAGGSSIVRTQVMHPGSQFPAQEYLRIQADRVTRTIDVGINKSAADELGKAA